MYGKQWERGDDHLRAQSKIHYDQQAGQILTTYPVISGCRSRRSYPPNEALQNRNTGDHVLILMRVSQESWGQSRCLDPVPNIASLGYCKSRGVIQYSHPFCSMKISFIFKYFLNCLADLSFCLLQKKLIKYSISSKMVHLHSEMFWTAVHISWKVCFVDKNTCLIIWSAVFLLSTNFCGGLPNEQMAAKWMEGRPGWLQQDLWSSYWHRKLSSEHVGKVDSDVQGAWTDSFIHWRDHERMSKTTFWQSGTVFFEGGSRFSRGTIDKFLLCARHKLTGLATCFRETCRLNVAKRPHGVLHPTERECQCVVLVIVPSCWCMYW